MEKSEMIFKSVNNRAPYIVDEDSKCLRQLHLTEIVYDLTSGETKLKWIEAETGAFMLGDLSDKQVYGSEEQFKKGETIKRSDLYTEVSFAKVINYATPNRNVKTENNRLYSWVYENGVATKYYYDERIKTITTTFGSDGCGVREIKTDVEFPEMYYDAEEVYEFNDYEIVNNDGTKTFHEGLCRRFELTKEQHALVDKLQDVVNECMEAGIKITFDLGIYELVAFNVKGIDRIEYEPEYDEDTEVCHRLNFRNERKIKGVYDVNTDDPSVQFVVKKDSIKESR